MVDLDVVVVFGWRGVVDTLVICGGVRGPKRILIVNQLHVKIALRVTEPDVCSQGVLRTQPD